ncbi:MAG TPA: (d)CMP kinase, partial [Rikenellaceae bacterium]|nr:(d)CMP kinase [Rikenellaceae bacterium]
GKSTVAKRLAKELGWYFLNTGSFYRAYTLAQLNKGLDPLDKDSVLETARKTVLTVENGSICINGVDSENLLHTPLVDKYASPVSSDPRLRELVTNLVRKIAGNMNIVTEGRDTTTVIFPNADYKFYFDASVEERAKRRVEEQKGVTYEEVLASIKKRDKNDMEKEVGALKKAKNAIYIDTTNLTIDAVCEKVLLAMQKH